MSGKSKGGSSRGGGNKKSTPKAKKKSNSTSKYFNSSSTPKASSPVADKGMYNSKAAQAESKAKALITQAEAATAKTTPLASPKFSASPTHQKATAPVAAINPAQKASAAKALITQAEAKTKADKVAADKVKSNKVKSDKAGQEAAAAKALITQAEAKAKKSILLDESNKAEESAPINLSKDNKTVAEVPRYDQKYWANQLAKGVSQADMKKEQDSIGMKKAYSGDKVVTEDMKRKASDDLSRVTGSMATLQNGGVVKTKGKKYGLLGENQNTTYDYKGGPSIVTKANDPSLFGFNFGDKTSTTYVDGTEVATKTGRDPLGKDATVTRPEGLAGDINDTQPIDPVKAAEQITDIDNQIKVEKDPVKLKELHQRRLSLFRMRRTNTKFSGVLGEADTKRTNLMSIM